MIRDMAFVAVVSLFTACSGVQNSSRSSQAAPRELGFEDSLTSGAQIGLRPGEIALTLDDGPIPESLPFAQRLAKAEIPVTYFWIGKNVQSNPDIADAMSEIRFSTGPHAGARAFMVGNHSWDHKRKYNDISCIACDGTSYALDEIERAADVIEPYIKKMNTPYFFRAPGGNFFRRGNADETASLDALNETLSRYIGPFYWDVDGDVNPGACENGAEACRNFYLSQVRSLINSHGIIILAHDINPMTRRMLLGDGDMKGLIQTLQEDGDNFVALNKYPAQLAKYGPVPMNLKKGSQLR